jgi:hypothetical protein
MFEHHEHGYHVQSLTETKSPGVQAPLRTLRRRSRKPQTGKKRRNTMTVEGNEENDGKAKRKPTFL